MSASPLAAQQLDASFWLKISDGDVRHIPWYVYNGEDVVVDARFNFDQPETFAVFLGRPFGSGNLTLTPSFGCLIGPDYMGLSVQFNVLAALNKRTSLFALNQYALMDDTPDFLYHWGDLLYSLNDRILVGLDEQIYKESGSGVFIDIGPVVKVPLPHGLYAKLWAAWDPFHNYQRKVFLGIGYTR
jgi:hypothetical protein